MMSEAPQIDELDDDWLLELVRQRATAQVVVEGCPEAFSGELAAITGQWLVVEQRVPERTDGVLRFVRLHRMVVVDVPYRRDA